MWVHRGFFWHSYTDVTNLHKFPHSYKYTSSALQKKLYKTLANNNVVIVHDWSVHANWRYFPRLPQHFRSTSTVLLWLCAKEGKKWISACKHDIDISRMSSMTESWMEIYPHLQFLISYVSRPSLFLYSQLCTEQKIGKNRNRVKPTIRKVEYLCTADRSLAPGWFYHKTTNLQEVENLQ